MPGQGIVALYCGFTVAKYRDKLRLGISRFVVGPEACPNNGPSNARIGFYLKETYGICFSATGFKPDVPRQLLTLTPGASGDFRAPWATRDGFGRISRTGGTLAITSVSGHIGFKILRVNLPVVKKGALINGKKPAQRITREGENNLITFEHALNLTAGETLSVS